MDLMTAAPFAGAGLLMLGGGWLLYRVQEKSRSREELVAWVRLYEDQRATAQRKRLWRRALFILQLLALACIAVLLFGLQPGSSGVQTVLLDRSLSMLSSSDTTGTRFAAGRAWLEQRLREHPRDRVELYAAGLETLPQRFADARTALKAIEALDARELSDPLTTLLPNLEAELASAAPRRLLVVTDNLPKALETRLNALEVPVEARVIGGGQANVSIDRFRVSAGFLNRHPDEVQIHYRVSRSGGGPERVRLRLRLLDPKTDRLLRQDTLDVDLSTGVHTRTLSLSELAREIGLVDDLADAGAGATSVRLPLALQLELLASAGDDLAADNQAWALLPEITPIRLGVHDRRLYEFLREEFRLDGVDHDSGTAGRPDPWLRRIEVLDVSDESARPVPFDVSVYNRSPPRSGEALEPRPSLYMLARPPVANITFPDDPVIAAVETQFLNADDSTLAYRSCDIVNWDRRDPLLKYLENFSVARLDVSMYPFTWLVLAVNFRSFEQRQFKPDWMQNVIICMPESVPGITIPVAMRGVDSNRYAAVFNFDITDYDLRVYRDLKILLINTVRWLYEPTRLPETIAAGTAMRLPGEAATGSWRLQGPSFPAATLVGERTPILAQGGVYRLKDADTDLTHWFAVGPPADAREHDLTRTALKSLHWRNPVLSPLQPAVADADAAPTAQLWQRLALALLPLLIASEALLRWYFARQRHRRLGVAA